MDFGISLFYLLVNIWFKQCFHPLVLSPKKKKAHITTSCFGHVLLVIKVFWAKTENAPFFSLFFYYLIDQKIWMLLKALSVSYTATFLDHHHSPPNTLFSFLSFMLPICGGAFTQLTLCTAIVEQQYGRH